jgi:hypothetical protein
MSVWIAVLWAVAIFYSGILAGGVITISLAMIPALRTFDPETDFEVNRIFNPLPGGYMPWACLLSAFGGIGILTLTDDLEPRARTLTSIALAATAAVIVISLHNRRINPPGRAAEPADRPVDYAQMRRVWDLGHWVRSALCLLVLVCYVIGALAQGDGAGGLVGVLLVLSVAAAALIAGGMVVVQMAVMPTINLAGDRLGVRVHTGFDRYVELHLPAFAILTILAGLGALVFDEDRAGGATALVALGVLSAAAAAVISHFFNRRMNAQLKRWDPEALPAEYGALRRRWDRLHHLRSAAAVLAFLCLLFALLLR